jgi:hypothetical protein
LVPARQPDGTLSNRVLGGAMVKRMFFFKDGSCFEYDPRAGADRVVNGPFPIGTRFKGLNAAFSSGLDAAVNWGDGFVYFFKGDRYWKYDALGERADTPAPRKIATGWPTLPASFITGIDAAFNSGTGKAYFFKGDEYVRYDVKSDRLDAPDPGTPPYPRKIGDSNGWHGLPLSFQAGIDAAVFAGDGKIYFFKDTEYVRLTFSSRTVDAISPPYPLKIDPLWQGLPSTLDAGVEWIQAGTATLDITVNPTGCQKVTGPGIGEAALGQAFTMKASFASTGHPSVCGCAAYRQFVRGDFVLNGQRRDQMLPNQNGGPDVPLLPRPAPGAADDNFREDGIKGRAYGHRKDPPQPKDNYDNPNQRSGCRYKGSDAPLLSAQETNTVTIDLDFRGLIIDVSAGNEVLVTKEWKIFCSGVL